jgi:hypothetical protein
MRNAMTWLVATIVTFALHEGAHAAERTYSASECQIRNQSQQYQLLPGGIQNNAASTLEVMCPIDRGLTSSSIFWTRVHVFNASTQQFSCTVYSFDSWGTALSFKTASTTQQGQVALDLENPDQFADWGTFVLYCAVPGGGSYISGYAVSSS